MKNGPYDEINDVAHYIALEFWKAGAILYSNKKLFDTSPNKSPFYIDSRLLIGNINAREKCINEVLEIIERIDFEIVAGGETGGIPFSSYIADRLKVPQIYIRKKQKSKGTKSQIEGMKEEDIKNKKILLIEDTVTYGISKINFILAIRDYNGIVNDCFVLCDRKQKANEKLKEHGVNLYSLTNIDALLDTGVEEGYIPPAHVKDIVSFLKDEKEWHLRRGLKYTEPY